MILLLLFSLGPLFYNVAYTWLAVLVQRFIDVHHVVVSGLDKILDDDVEAIAVGEGQSGTAQQLYRLVQR